MTLPIPLNEPASNVANDLLNLFRAVTSWRGRHANAQSICTLKSDRFPGTDPLSVACQTLGSSGSCQDASGLWKVGATGWVEVIAVMIVAEQDDIDCSKSRYIQGRASLFKYFDGTSTITVFRWLEGWIS